jgi:hypothetical protein
VFCCSGHFLLFVAPFGFKLFVAVLLLKIFHNAVDSENGFSLTRRATVPRAWINGILEESNGFRHSQSFSWAVSVHGIRDFLTSCALGCARGWHVAWKAPRSLGIFISSFPEAKQGGVTGSPSRRADHRATYFFI